MRACLSVTSLISPQPLSELLRLLQRSPRLHFSPRGGVPPLVSSSRRWVSLWISVALRGGLGSRLASGCRGPLAPCGPSAFSVSPLERILARTGPLRIHRRFIADSSPPGRVYSGRGRRVFADPSLFSHLCRPRPWTLSQLRRLATSRRKRNVGGGWKGSSRRANRR